MITSRVVTLDLFGGEKHRLDLGLQVRVCGTPGSLNRTPRGGGVYTIIVLYWRLAICDTLQEPNGGEYLSLRPRNMPLLR